MAIIKAPRNITVTVPRHNSQVIGAKLDKEIKKQVKEKNIRADVTQSSAELTQAIESASEWNSLLITARAERGPQWDIGTQQFLVEEFSDLYYDPTLLFEAVNKVKEEEGVGSSGSNDQPHQPPNLPPHHHQMQTPQHPHGPPQHHVSQYNMGSPRHQTPMRGGEREPFHPAQMGGGQHMPEPSPLRHGHGGGGMQGNFGGFPASPGGMNMRGPPGAGSFPVSPGVVPGQGGGGAAPFNPMQQQQQQFFAGGGNPAVGSPMRMASMGGGMGMDDHGMGGMGGMGMGGGMQGMGVGGAPQMTRRMTRGMGEGFNCFGRMEHKEVWDTNLCAGDLTSPISKWVNVKRSVRRSLDRVTCKSADKASQRQSPPTLETYTLGEVPRMSMSIINTYKPPVLQELTEPAPGPFDVYFNGPVPERLESPRVRLVPYVPSVHSEAFFNEYQKSPELEKFLPFAWPDYPSFLTWMQNNVLSDPKALVLAIIDRTKGNDGENIEESIAGLIGYLNCAPHNLSVEIGPVIVLSRAQRTFVSSNAIGLVLKYALDLPKDGGVGYRRVTWTANPNNKASVRAAERMGLKIEGELRWTWVMPIGKDGGLPLVDGKRGEGQGRNSTLLSLCWDDWEAGAKQHVEKMIERV